MTNSEKFCKTCKTVKLTLRNMESIPMPKLEQFGPHSEFYLWPKAWEENLRHWNMLNDTTGNWQFFRDDIKTILEEAISNA